MVKPSVCHQELHSVGLTVPMKGRCNINAANSRNHSIGCRYGRSVSWFIRPLRNVCPRCNGDPLGATQDVRTASLFYFIWLDRDPDSTAIEPRQNLTSTRQPTLRSPSKAVPFVLGLPLLMGSNAQPKTAISLPHLQMGIWACGMLLVNMKATSERSCSCNIFSGLRCFISISIHG